jgi:hypothetical protein
MIESRIEDTMPPVVERPGLAEAVIGGDPVLPSSTAITSAGTGCSEQQEAGPQEETASASPRDRPVEGTIRSVAEDAECVRLERVSVVVEENALAGVVDANKAEPVVRETEGNALAGVADMDKVEAGVREAEGNALAGEVDAESTESKKCCPTDGEDSTKGTGPVERYERLFTDAELDALELGEGEATWAARGVRQGDGGTAVPAGWMRIRSSFAISRTPKVKRSRRSRRGAPCLV